VQTEQGNSCIIMCRNLFRERRASTFAHADADQDIIATMWTTANWCAARALTEV